MQVYVCVNLNKCNKNHSPLCQTCLNFTIARFFKTHWGRVTHICVSKLTIIGSDNVLSPEGQQAIIWTNAGILLIWPLGTNLSEISIEIQTFLLKKIRLKMFSAKCCLFRLGLNVLTPHEMMGGQLWGAIWKPMLPKWNINNRPDIIHWTFIHILSKCMFEKAFHHIS